MGKELSTQGTLNSFELINHKSEVYLWLHQILDNVKTTKFATFENAAAAMYALLGEGFGDLYADIEHNHDAAYSSLMHAHSQYLESVAWSIITGKPETYPPETHTHAQYLQVAFCEWVGNTTTPVLRNINFTPTITPKVIVMIGYRADYYDGFLGLWLEGFGDTLFNMRVVANTPGMWFLEDIFNDTPSAGVLPLYATYYNHSSYSYKAVILGVL